MSTSYYPIQRLRELCHSRELDIVPLVEDENEYVIMRNWDEKKLFQGNSDRCSDFFRGYSYSW